MSKPITRAEFDALKTTAYAALDLAVMHDPDHAKQIRALENSVVILERQMKRIGAPAYRVLHPGKLPKTRRTK